MALSLENSVQSIKYLVETQLVPPHVRPQSSKFPNPIHLPIEVVDDRMPMATQLDLLKANIRILLVGGTQLMMANDLVVGDLLPPALANQVLCLHCAIAQEAWVRNHGHVLIGGHLVPFPQPDHPVVHRQGRRNDTAQPLPILAMMTVVSTIAYRFPRNLQYQRSYLGVIAISPVEG